MGGFQAELATQHRLLESDPVAVQTVLAFPHTTVFGQAQGLGAARQGRALLFQTAAVGAASGWACAGEESSARDAKASCCTPRPRTTPFLEEMSILWVIYGVLLWAGVIPATPPGSRGRPVLCAGHVRLAAVGFVLCGVLVHGRWK